MGLELLLSTNGITLPSSMNHLKPSKSHTSLIALIHQLLNLSLQSFQKYLIASKWQLIFFQISLDLLEAYSSFQLLWALNYNYSMRYFRKIFKSIQFLKSSTNKNYSFFCYHKEQVMELFFIFRLPHNLWYYISKWIYFDRTLWYLLIITHFKDSVCRRNKFTSSLLLYGTVLLTIFICPSNWHIKSMGCCFLWLYLRRNGKNWIFWNCRLTYNWDWLSW